MLLHGIYSTACGMWHVACGMWHRDAHGVESWCDVAHRMLHVACCMLHVACCMLHVVCSDDEAARVRAVLKLEAILLSKLQRYPFV